MTGAPSAEERALEPAPPDGQTGYRLTASGATERRPRTSAPTGSRRTDDQPARPPTEDQPAQPRADPAAVQDPRLDPGPSVVRHRSEVEIRWRQARNPPPPVVRAVLANLAIATVGGVVLLLADWLAGTGGAAAVVYVVVVVVSGSLLTWLWVELPTGEPGVKRRSPWAAVLGFFASVPIVYMALVIVYQVLRPLLP